MRFKIDFFCNRVKRFFSRNRVEFPKTLNLNGYVAETNITSNMYKEEGSEGFPEEIAGSSSKCDDSSTTDSGSAIDDENCLTSSNDLNNVDYEQVKRSCAFGTRVNDNGLHRFVSGRRMTKV